MYQLGVILPFRAFLASSEFNILLVFSAAENSDSPGPRFV